MLSNVIENHPPMTLRQILCYQDIQLPGKKGKGLTAYQIQAVLLVMNLPPMVKRELRSLLGVTPDYFKKSIIRPLKRIGYIKDDGLHYVYPTGDLEDLIIQRCNMEAYDRVVKDVGDQRQEYYDSDFKKWEEFLALEDKMREIGIKI